MTGRPPNRSTGGLPTSGWEQIASGVLNAVGMRWVLEILFCVVSSSFGLCSPTAARMDQIFDSIEGSMSHDVGCPDTGKIGISQTSYGSGEQVLKKAYAMRRTRMRCTREFKVSAVRMVVDKGVSLVEVAAPSCLRQWRKEYSSLGNGSFPGKGKMPEKDAENARLRRESRRLLADREILKNEAIFLRTGDSAL